jgi:hypothetical protein
MGGSEHHEQEAGEPEGRSLREVHFHVLPGEAVVCCGVECPIRMENEETAPKGYRPELIHRDGFARCACRVSPADGDLVEQGERSTQNPADELSNPNTGERLVA